MRLRDALVLVALVGCKAPGVAGVDAQDDGSFGADGAASDAAEVVPEGYSALHILVHGVSLSDVAADFGTNVSDVGPSGWAAMDVPEGVAFGAFLHELRGDDRLTDALAMGLVAGAGDGEHGDDGHHGDDGDHGDDDDDDDDDHDDDDDDDDDDGDHHGHEGDRVGSIGQLQWHLPAIGVPHGGSFKRVTVAVLDSGVAYEDLSDATGTYVRAHSLHRSPIRAPWDFVNSDAHPNDDHQHGTFMATVIGASGSVKGVAPGVGLMPVKVLDSHNAGDELWLVDGIWHAVDNGADVINLSLSFGPGYVPSRALQGALIYAHDSGVVVVAAAGNEGNVGVSWPAASPLVVAVGASERVMSGPSKLAAYSNRSPKIDVVAPGGDLSTDADGDGMVDGIVSETINEGDPTTLAKWMFAGTSSAAAMTSGTVARLLDAGALPEDVPSLLGAGATPFDGGIHALAGAGTLNVRSSLAASASPTPITKGDAHSVAMFAYLVRSGLKVVPTARLTVVDGQGIPVAGREVLGTLWGEGGGAFACTTSQCGSCTVSGPAVSARTLTGASRGLAWAFRAEAVVDSKGVVRPGAALFPSQKLDAVTRSLQADPRTAGGLLAFSWRDTDDLTLGAVGEGYSVVDLAAGMSAAPMSVVYNKAALPGADQVVNVPLDGTGLSSIPVGNLKVFVGQPSGVRLANLKLAAIDGTGASNADLNFGAVDMFGGKGLPACTASSDALWLDSPTQPATQTGDLLAGGGWVTPDGYAGASLVGAVVAAPSSNSSAGAMRTGSVPLP